MCCEANPPVHFGRLTDVPGWPSGRKGTRDEIPNIVLFTAYDVVVPIIMIHGVSHQKSK